MKNFLSLTLLISVMVAFASCKKDGDSDSDPNPDPDPNPISKIYIAGTDTIMVGSNVISIAKYWVDGEAHSLTDGTNTASVSSIYVANGHIYVAGYEKINGESVAKYWKDGEAVVLGDGVASSIVVVGDDVYTAGTSDQKAVYWKNKEINILPEGTEASSIAVVDGNIYVAGFQRINLSNTYTYTAKYWKNGIGVNLTTSSRMVSAKSICAKGNDVYIVGYEQNSNRTNIAQYWKNNDPAMALSTIKSTAYSIFVEGNDVYIVGTIANESNTSNIVYWKNGVLTDLGFKGDARGIAVSEGDVYVVGTETSENWNYTAKYWKNGVSTTVEGLDRAHAIFLAK